MRLFEFDGSTVRESNVDRNNAEYNKTNYPHPNDDTMYTNNTFGDNLAYQDFASKKNTAQQNRINNASRDASYKATLSAQSQHTSPVHASQEDWNMWMRQGGIDYAREMDIEQQKKKDRSTSDTDYAERQAYIRSQNRIAQTKQ